MSQSKQETSKKKDPVQAKKIFEDDIGEDFLSSWKPSAPKKDATLDFGSEAPLKAKRTSFSLDKFDVDFDFDGGFGKLSTFDVDMSDLDFRSPPSKTQKSKAKIQETPQEKKDGFEFEFDFNGLDGFDLDCMLPKGREEKKIPVHEKALTPSSEVSEAISKSKSNTISGEEEKENVVQENASMPSSEKSESVSKSKIKVISQNMDDNSESHDSGAIQQRSPEAHLKFKPSELSMEEVDSQHGVPSKSLAQSPCTSGLQDLGSKQHTQTNPDKQNITEDSCFRNLLQTGDSDTVKQRSIVTESKYFDKVAVPKSKSKAISQNVDNKNESRDSRAVAKQPTVAHSTIKLSEFSMEDVDFQHENPSKSLVKSVHTNGSQDVRMNQCKQSNADKQGVIVDTCFENLFQTGDAINVKQTSNLTESKYSDKVTFSRSENTVISQSIDNNSECRDNRTVPKQPTAPYSNFKLSEFSIEDVASQHRVPPKSLSQSPFTSGSQDVGTEQCKQITAEKQDDAMDTFFGNTLKVGDSNGLKQTSNLTESQYSDKVGSSPSSSSCLGSRHKLSSHIISPPKGTPSSKDLEGDQDQSLAQTGSLYKRMTDYDSASKNSSPRKIEHSKCTSDNYASTSICTVDSSDMKQTRRKLITVAQKDINDITKRQVNQCQNQEDFGEYISTLPRTPFSVMQRPRENFLQGLKKNCQTTSLAKDGHKVATERNSSAAQSKSQHTSQKDLLSGVAKINDTKIRIGKGSLWESSKAIVSGTKSASVLIPQKHSKTLPNLQVARSQVANGKPKTVLKQTNEKLSSSKLTISLSPNSCLTKKILPLTEQNNTPWSPLAPLKRKPMEKLIAEASTMNPLKRISGSLPLTENMLVDNARKNHNYLPSLKGLATEQTYRKTPRGHPSESLPGVLSEEKSQYSQKLPKSVVQEEGLENDRQAEFTGSTDQPDQHLNCHSLLQKQIKDSDDISILEIDDNVKKADSFSRELEDMCNMLQNKHEEAKDILVRAIVTNNLLLMLNHPLHEEKIQTIKMYAVSMVPEESTR